MRFGILGPVEVWTTTGRPVPVGGPRLRALLAMLLFDPGQVVGVDRLARALWDEHPDGDPGNALQSQVSRLRRALRAGRHPDEADPVRSHPGGYLLAVDPDDVDLHRCTALARRARTCDSPTEAIAHYDEALRLWRGDPLADLADLPVGRDRTPRLTDLRATLVQDRAEAVLAAIHTEPGHPAVPPPADLVDALRHEVDTYPLRERLRGLLMRALHAAG